MGAGASVAGPVIVGAGKLVGLGQTLVRVQERSRRLTAQERALLEDVYRDSVAYDRIRIVEGPAGVFSVNKRPFTLGNTIYLKRIDPGADPWTLVHECCHVWQNQHVGSRYAAEALWAQARVKPSAYRWVDELGRGRTSWLEFNREAQAQFLQDYAEGNGTDARFEHRGTDYTDFARETLAYVRGLPPR